MNSLTDIIIEMLMVLLRLDTLETGRMDDHINDKNFIKKTVTTHNDFKLDWEDAKKVDSAKTIIL